MDGELADRKPRIGATANLIANDRLGFRAGSQVPNYRLIADFVQLSIEDLSKIGNVARSSVQFDDRIPVAIAERLREVASIANLVADFFDGDVEKTKLWFELPNPQLGEISPRNLIRAGRHERLFNFFLEACEAGLEMQTASGENSAR